MLKNNEVTRLAKLSGKSKATVSRVLNNCPGVTGDVREEILCQAFQNKIPLSSKAQTQLAVILPDLPKFFWQEAQKAVVSASTDYSKQLHVYTAIPEGGVLSSYLEQIEQSGVPAVIVAGIPTKKQAERFATFATKGLLIQLCEYTPVPNTFYVGSDPYDDGVRLGKLVLEQTAEESASRCFALLEYKSSYISRERIRGFSEAVKGAAALTVLEEPSAGPLYPAQLARMLTETNLPFTHVYGTGGLTVPACDGLRKIKQRKIRYIGFEEPPRAAEYVQKGMICAYAVQDIREQLRLAMDLTGQYLHTGFFPEQKFTYVPSEIKGIGN